MPLICFRPLRNKIWAGKTFNARLAMGFTLFTFKMLK